MTFSRLADDTLLIRLRGSWKMQDGLPSVGEVQKQVQTAPQLRRIAFDMKEVSAWDSGLLTFLKKVIDESGQHKVEIDRAGLPDGVRRLLDLAAAVPERQGARKHKKHDPFLERIGCMSIGFARSAPEMLGFIGEAFLVFIKLLQGKARFRRVDLVLTIQECGAQALPIVTLISVLVGLILAFVGALQLEQFGAEIFVANLVAVGMAREMGAMMTAIIMAGRTGAAFAAQLGTMRVNQEIDALTSLGISPMEFLVLPRMLALMLMMPLLAVYANVLGILGGGLVGVGMLDLGVEEYIVQTRNGVTVTDFAVGLFKSAVFGVLVAIAGCLRGMQSGSSSAAVGLAATSAVVTGIVFIIVADSLLTVVYSVLGI
ncbi:MAG: ABC transporter permease [Nitrospiraceae bacterium]